MTYPGDYIEDSPQNLDEEMRTIPVHIASSDAQLFRSVAAEFGSTMTFPAVDVAANSPVQILNRKPKRHRAVIVVQAFAAGVTSVVISSNRAALAVPVLPLAAGPYLVFTVAPFTYVWESQQPAWAVAPGAGVNTQPILVLDESYG